MIRSMLKSEITDNRWYKSMLVGNTFWPIIGNWVKRAVGLTNSTNSVLYAPLANANWYVFGNAGSNLTTYLYSTDTSSWTTGTLPVAGNWGVAAYNGTRIVLFETVASTAILTTTNGTTWTSGTIASQTTGGAIYDGTRFIATNTATNTLQWSLNGTTGWTSQNVSAGSFGIAYDGSSRYIITRNGASPNAQTSTTGIAGTWSAVTLPASDTWRQVVYAGGYWVVVAVGGNIAYSTNGTTWTASATSSNNNTWVYARGNWYSFTSGASASGRYRVTPDATSTSFNLGSASGSPNAVAFADDRMVVATSGTDLWVGV